MLFRAIVLLLVVGLLFVDARAQQPRTLTVLAAISLRDALTELKPLFEELSGTKVDLVLGSTGQLAAQIRNGAPADVFLAAADVQVDELVEARLAIESSRVVVATNRLVLVVAAKSATNITKLEDVRDEAIRRFAIGEPRSVPAGMYAMQALARLGLEAVVREKLIYGAHAKQVADYVVRGEADAGLIYQSDAKDMPDLRVVSVLPEALHEPIRYPGVVLAQSREVELSKRFLAFLTGDEGRAALERSGLLVAAAPTTQNAPVDSR